MAWRIDEHVIRGEIDNRTRGRVTGRIWFAGRAEPVALDLTGNAWRDLAGRRLEFVNPEPKPGLPDSFAMAQRGVVGDITASRKVKVPEIPLDQIGEYYAARRPFPWHWGNCLYLEWFGERNGRVVIETPLFQLTVSPEIAWDMSEPEELEQRRANGEALTGFMGRLADAVERAQASEAGESPADDTWSVEADRPQTEEEAERMLADSDQLSDRIAARMQQEGEDADFERILEEELERRRRERGEPPPEPPTPEEEAEDARWIEEMNQAAQEAADDPELDETVRQEHPLAVRARELSGRMALEPENRGWMSEESQSEHPVVEPVNSVWSASGKLAGALNGREWPPPVDRCGMAIAWLKRARGYLDDALAAVDACAEEKLTEPGWLAGVRTELAAIAGETIADLRARLERGFD